MLVATGLRKKYKQREVVKEFGLTLEAGEVVGLLGPNGAGKTTCFYMIVGLVEADAGRIELDGRDLTAEPMYARAKLGVGYLPQEPSIFRKLTVADNIRLAGAARGTRQRRPRERTGFAARRTADHHVADQLGASLSGGERRRCEIARALAAKPRMMLWTKPSPAWTRFRSARSSASSSTSRNAASCADHRSPTCARPWESATARISSPRGAYWRRGHQTCC
ncbi:ATP-binding cassette domain-containing protein [Xanthomonas oryzae pv. oryzae]|nr:ATP-binding cassette domain-containing protein [Xanthomonas oryzae pv. oryzae]